MADNLSSDDIAVTPPHLLVDLAYHLGVTAGELPVDDTPEPEIVVVEHTVPMYVPDGWHL